MHGLWRVVQICSFGLFGVLSGCGTEPVPIEEPKPGLRWSPATGVVIEATEFHDSEGALYRVSILCTAYIDFTEQTVSEVEEECSLSDFEGEALLLVTRNQLQQIYDYWRRWN